MNPRSSLAGSSIAAVLAVLVSFVGAQFEPVPTGTVELTVRAPTGEALANTELLIRPDASSSDRYSRKYPLRAKTNARGAARFAWPVGVTRLHVIARGSGYGSTGYVVVMEKGTARPALPPLFPFGRIEGVVPADIREPGTYVRLGAEHPDLVDRQAAVDARGKFVFTDVPFGRWLLVLRNDKKDLGVEAWVRVAPGQRAISVRFVKTPVENPPVKSPNKPSPERVKRKPVWAGGTVTDVNGVPVEGGRCLCPRHRLLWSWVG